MLYISQTLTLAFTGQSIKFGNFIIIKINYKEGREKSTWNSFSLIL